jgi:hypothetical protein
MFKVTIAMVVVGDECESFEKAFKKFYEELNKLVESETSRQVLETACFIQYVFDDEGDTLITMLDFYGCCDLASQIGLLSDNGDLKEQASNEVSIKDIQNAFLKNTAMEISAILEMVDNVRGAIPSQ